MLAEFSGSCDSRSQPWRGTNRSIGVRYVRISDFIMNEECGMTMHPWHCIALVYLHVDRGAMCFDWKRSSPGAIEFPPVLSDQVGAVAKGSGLLSR